MNLKSCGRCDGIHGPDECPGSLLERLQRLEQRMDEVLARMPGVAPVKDWKAHESADPIKDLQDAQREMSAARPMTREERWRMGPVLAAAGIDIDKSIRHHGVEP